MTHDDLLLVLGVRDTKGHPRSLAHRFYKERKTTRLATAPLGRRTPQVPALDVSGQQKNDDDRGHPDSSLTMFRRAPLPRMQQRNDLRPTPRWVVDRMQRGIGSRERRVDESVPIEVLRALRQTTPSPEPVAAPPKPRRKKFSVWNPGSLHSGGVSLSGGHDSSEWTALRDEWLHDRQTVLHPRKAHRGVHSLATGPRERLPSPASPKSSTAVRIKRRTTSEALLGMDLEAVLGGYPRFKELFSSFSPADQELWRLHWSDRHPQLRAALDGYIGAGLFSEGVVSHPYCDLFQQGVFER